jgi:hypothetical protein
MRHVKLALVVWLLSFVVMGIQPATAATGEQQGTSLDGPLSSEAPTDSRAACQKIFNKCIVTCGMGLNQNLDSCRASCQLDKCLCLKAGRSAAQTDDDDVCE